jgi:hypothetical protein
MTLITLIYADLNRAFTAEARRRGEQESRSAAARILTKEESGAIPIHHLQTGKSRAMSAPEKNSREEVRGRMEDAMQEVVLKRFEKPDEIRTFEKGKFELVRIGGIAAAAR